MAEKKNETWATFRIDADLMRQLNRAAKIERAPRSWVIRKLLLQALAQNEKTA